jgi:hypothetical protein
VRRFCIIIAEMIEPKKKNSKLADMVEYLLKPAVRGGVRGPHSGGRAAGSS